MQLQQLLADLAGDLDRLHVRLLLVACDGNQELLILVVERPLQALSLLSHQVNVLGHSVLDPVAPLGLLLIADEAKPEPGVPDSRNFDLSVLHEGVVMDGIRRAGIVLGG